MIVKDVIRDLVEESLKKAIADGRIPETAFPLVKVEYPKDDTFGDYATPFALESAKLLKQNPIQLADILREYIAASKIASSVSVAKPGFINVFLSPDFLIENLGTVLKENNAYGKNVKAQPRKVNLEFVSANPTGPLNIVSARAAAIGDTLANLIEASGDTIDREFYINDFGNQVNLLGKSVYARLRELDGEAYPVPDEGYHGAYVIDIARYVKENFSAELAACKTDEDKFSFLAEKAIEYNTASQKKVMQQFNVTFTRWFSERTLHQGGEVSGAYDFLESKNVIYDEDGKKVFRSTDFGDDKDRVVVREDGRPTYLMADIAYHRNKLNRGYNLIIDIWGPDHHGYIARLAGAMTAMGAEPGSFKVLLAQQVNLVSGGELVKMSKRLGNFSTMQELIDEIGVDAARYFFVMRSLDSHLDFDLELAKKQSSENPVFYLQYAHARICSIFREAEKRGLPMGNTITAKYLDNPESRELLKMLVRFPEEITDSANTFEPHRITNFLMRLAQAYHKFYVEQRVLSPEEPAKTETLLALCGGVRIVLKNGLTLLGVSAPEQM